MIQCWDILLPYKNKKHSIHTCKVTRTKIICESVSYKMNAIYPKAYHSLLCQFWTAPWSWFHIPCEVVDPFPYWSHSINWTQLKLWCSRICGQRRPLSGVGIKLYEVRSISPSSFCVFGFSNSCVILCIKQRQRAKINLSGITKGGSQVVGTFGVFCVVPVVLAEGIVFTKWRDTSTTGHYSNKGIRPMWGIPSSLLSF